VGSREERSKVSGAGRNGRDALALTHERLLLSLVGRGDAFRFRRVLDLPDDATAMTLEQLDRLIGYHDELRARHDAALVRLNAVRDQIEAALAEHGGDVLGDLRETDAAPLIDSWAEASVEYNRCCREIEAVGAYAASLDQEEERD
jgi:hypothetical protein